MTLKTALKQLEDLFDDDPDTWIKNKMMGIRQHDGFVRNVLFGKEMRYEVNCWCLAGGADKIANGDGFLYEQMLKQLSIAINPDRKQSVYNYQNRVTSWNDAKSRKFSEIKKVIKRARALL